VSTEISDDKENDGFFDAVERTYNTSPRNDIKHFLSDFNV
jgi:hypothetical protein